MHKSTKEQRKAMTAVLVQETLVEVGAEVGVAEGIEVEVLRVGVGVKADIKEEEEEEEEEAAIPPPLDVWTEGRRETMHPEQHQWRSKWHDTSPPDGG